MSDLSIALRLYLESSQARAGARAFGQEWRSTFSGANREARAFGGELGRVERAALGVRRGLGGIRETLGLIGISAGVVATLGKLRASGELDRDLTRIRQTAGGSAQQMRDLRGEIFRLGTDTGRPLDTLKGGFNSLVQSGLEWAQANEALKAINPASAVTGAAEDVLAGGLTVAANAYKFDLSQPGRAIELLDQMTVAGRLGNAELEDLAGIFARVGVNAKAANLAFPDALGFVESLSMIERQPERLATLADSTLRLFTNANYRKSAQRATGVQFYDASGKARDPVDVLDEISGKYKKLSTDRSRDKFIAGAFGQTDLDTQRGLRTLLAGSTLDDWRKMSSQIRDARGTINRDLPEALNNAYDQENRARLALSKVGDDIAQPINRSIANLIQYQMRPRSEGGLGLGAYGTAAATIGEIAALSAGGALSGQLLRKIPGLSGSGANLAGGLAAGHLVGETGLATPVFVVNWPGNVTAPMPALPGGPRPLPGTVGEGPLRLPGPAQGAPTGLFSKLLGIGSTVALADWITEGIGAQWQRAGDINAVRSEPYDALNERQRRLVDELGSEAVRVSRQRRGSTDDLDVGGDGGVPQYLSRAQPAPHRVSGTLRIVIDQQGRARVAGFESSGFDMEIQTGPLLPHIGG